MSQPFAFDKALQSGQALTGKDGILTPLIKQLTEAALAAELDSHLAQDVEANRKNGSGKKTVKATTGSFELATPRDRNGTFEPQRVKKRQTTLSDEIEQKIIRLSALGMSYANISREIEDLYAFSVSSAILQHRDGQGHSRTQTVATAPAGAGLSLRLAGRHSRQNPRGRPLHQQGGVYRAGT